MNNIIRLSLPPLEKWAPAGDNEPPELGLGHAHALLSPSVQLDGEVMHCFRLQSPLDNASAASPANLKLSVLGSSSRIVTEITLDHKYTDLLLCKFILKKDEACRFALSSDSSELIGELFSSGNTPELFTVNRAPQKIRNIDTIMPHWGGVKRLIHKKCRTSRTFNAFVSALEMRMGSEELLSVPQYVNFCPTGRCNALCDFCSVGAKRDGIIKKELPFDKVEDLLSIVGPVVRTFGLEGNGEPTLYGRFGDLVTELTASGSHFYLITNGEKLTDEHIDLCIATGCIHVNFSLNASNSGTHERIMKLKEFDKVISNIKKLVRYRGSHSSPSVSVSFVVVNANVHETVDFIKFAERELRVDQILVRPLGALSSEEGFSVEDIRDIVPYKADIQDMIDGVEEYLSDTARARTTFGRAVNVVFEPGGFANTRENPIDRVLKTPGYENRLLPPGRKYWRLLDQSASVSWAGARMTLSGSPGSGDDALIASDPIPVEPGCELELSFDARVEGANLVCEVRGAEGEPITSVEVPAKAASQKISVPVKTGSNKKVEITFRPRGGRFEASLDFQRTRTPYNGIVDKVSIPPRSQWELDTKDARVSWNGSVCAISWSGNGSPYLYKSYSIQCAPDAELDFPAKVRVDSGVLKIGVLNETREKWLHVFTFAAGNHDDSIKFNPAGNMSFQIVLFPGGPGELAAEIDWDGSISKDNGRPAREGGGNAAYVNKDGSYNKEEPQPVETGEGMAGSAKENAGAPVIYCQKPWTEISNFTVDGKMDICCIATGVGGDKYALGNFIHDDFQRFWNGERMKEFRRTVNSGDKLGVCIDCPMAYAYQGALFNPETTIWRLGTGIYNGVSRLFLGRRNKAVNVIVAAIFFPVRFVALKLFFKGFKKSRKLYEVGYKNLFEYLQVK